MGKLGGLVSLFKRPSVFHSALFGAVCGSAFYCGYIAWRGVKCQLFSTDYFARQSRWRYLEKQQLYSRELAQSQNASYVAALAEEYDPVALRAPGKPLDDSLRF